MKLAKTKGSGDNITVVVVFLKPIDELLRESSGYSHLTVDPLELDDELDSYPVNSEDPALYQGMSWGRQL